MEKRNCNVIYDLLPLYSEGICSKETSQMIEEHMEHCEECRKNLHFMESKMEIPEETDISLFKKIKHRIWIERLVIIFVSLFVAGNILFIGGSYMVFGQTTINDILEKEEVRIEQDENGDVWVVRSGKAMESTYTIPNLYTEDGYLIIGEGKSEVQDYNGAITVKVVLYGNRMTKLKQMLTEATGTQEERSLLFSVKEKPRYEQVVFEYSDGEVVLWEDK